MLYPEVDRCALEKLLLMMTCSSVHVTKMADVCAACVGSMLQEWQIYCEGRVGLLLSQSQLEWRLGSIGVSLG